MIFIIITCNSYLSKLSSLFQKDNFIVFSLLRSDPKSYPKTAWMGPFHDAPHTWIRHSVVKLEFFGSTHLYKFL